MPRVILSVSEEEKELWVREAHREMVTLSEWLRRAARKSVDAQPVGSPPVPIPPTAWQATEAVEEVVAVTTPEERHEEALTMSPPASTAKCRKEAMHHIYHAGKPCPACGFPNREGS